MPRRKERTQKKISRLHAIDHHEITPYLREFMSWCDEKNYSRFTRDGRKSAIIGFILWCDERDLDKPCDITKPILERYQRHLFYIRKKDGKPLSIRTQVSRTHGIQAFFKWLTKQNYILYNPASELDLPRIPKTLPRYRLSQDDIETILQQTHYSGEVGTRDRAIIETLYSTGMRRTELTELKLYDLDIDNGTVFIHQGKGFKDRLIPIGERACTWIRKYLDELRHELILSPDEGYLFISDLGKQYRKNQLGDMVKKYKFAAGIDIPGSCHLLRHACATHMLENGADIRYIQMILGHANLCSTEIYTQVSIQKLKDVHTATHPAKLERTQTTEKVNQETEDMLLKLLDEEDTISKC